MQTTLLDLDALARHLADCIRRSDGFLLQNLFRVNCRTCCYVSELNTNPSRPLFFSPPAVRSWTSRTGRSRTTGSPDSCVSQPASSNTNLHSSSPARVRSSCGTSTTSSSCCPAWPTALSPNANPTLPAPPPTTCWWRRWRARWRTTGCSTTGWCHSTCRVRTLNTSLLIGRFVRLMRPFPILTELKCSSSENRSLFSLSLTSFRCESFQESSYLK